MNVVPAPPIIDGGGPIIEFCGTSMVVDVCDILDGPRLPYGLGAGL